MKEENPYSCSSKSGSRRTMAALMADGFTGAVALARMLAAASRASSGMTFSFGFSRSFAGSPRRRHTGAADVDRKGVRPVRLGEADQLGEREELAFEADAVLVARPQRPHHVDGLVGATPPGREVDVHGRCLTRKCPDADRQQPHAAPRQHVDRRQPLREHHRMVVRQEQDGGPEENALGRSGDEAQTVERVRERQGRRQLDGTDRRSRVQHDVLGYVEGLESAPFRVRGQRDHRVRIDAVVGGVVGEPELHIETFRGCRGVPESVT